MNVQENAQGQEIIKGAEKYEEIKIEEKIMNRVVEKRDLAEVDRMLIMDVVRLIMNGLHPIGDPWFDEVDDNWTLRTQMDKDPKDY